MLFLNKDDKNYVEPDISVICDKSKLNEKGCFGSPDWIIEVVSASSKRLDYHIKLFKYRTAGVKEYWIIDPFKKVYIFKCGNLFWLTLVIYLRIRSIYLILRYNV